MDYNISGGGADVTSISGKSQIIKNQFVDCIFLSNVPHMSFTFTIDSYIIFIAAMRENKLWKTSSYQGCFFCVVVNYCSSRGEERILVEYQYDAWGKIIDIDYNSNHLSDAQEAHERNRYFYRGYRYDSEIDMHYLIVDIMMRILVDLLMLMDY